MAKLSELRKQAKEMGIPVAVIRAATTSAEMEEVISDHAGQGKPRKKAACRVLSTAPNLLYYGDNLDVLRHVKDETVDLVYLDPPFKSNRNYNVLFAEHGTRSAAKIKAFEDTWRWDESAVKSYEEMVKCGGDVAQAMRVFRTLLGTSDMLACSLS